MFYQKYKGKGQSIKTIVFLAAPVLFFYLVFFVELDKDNRPSPIPLQWHC